MLGHMLDTVKVIDWESVLTNRITNHRPYTIEVSMLKDAGAYNDVKVYPHELQTSLDDLTTWFFTRPQIGASAVSDDVESSPQDSTSR